uniref:Unc-13 homolog D (C. elegans) n=1 Tax=Pygocentrus nattereri TaxID=42514 RepID=A0AAR2LDQ4_PYGNA
MTDTEHESLSEKVENAEVISKLIWHCCFVFVFVLFFNPSQWNLHFFLIHTLFDYFVQKPFYCLKVTVKEAKGILGKDVSGFSDPYCLLTIMQKGQEAKSSSIPSKVQKAVLKDSAKRREVFQTDIKKQTLNPVWDQTFKLVFEDITSNNFHMEMWMIKDAKKEKGTDDFLGSVVLNLQDLHCTEDRWHILQPQTETYPDRGQCHMQFKFIHKEGRYYKTVSTTVFLSSNPFVVVSYQDSSPWKGELCGEGTTLLEHYAAQNDISPFLQDLAKWVAYSKLYQSLEVDSTVLFKQLTSIEYHWDQQELPYQQVNCRNLNLLAYWISPDGNFRASHLILVLFRGKVLQLTSFHEDFREALPYWLNKAFTTTSERVEKAVHVDQLQPLQTGSVPVKHSSSAVDIAACLQPICQLWEQLSWPDSEEGFMLMVKLTEDMCKIASTYCRLLKSRVKELSDNSDPGSAANMLCVVVNDLEHLRSVLNRLPQQLNWAGLRERTRNVIGETQFQNTLPSQLQHTQALLNREIRAAVDTLGKKVTHSRDASRIAVEPLMRYLEEELKYMNENLVQENFNSLLMLNSMSYQQLIEKFFERKIWEQKVCHGEKYGAVTLIVSYTRSEEKLHVEVLNAVKLIPLDSNGSSDPFVQLSLEPKHVFPQVEQRYTKIKNCDLNPLFEESFEFPVTLEQCQSAGACLLVTVLDHDTLRSDDFEGEAFLSLKAVPGVAGGGAPNPNPAQIRLPLLHPKPNSEATLKLLEARKGDREAQAFVKLRRQRERKSQEASNNEGTTK